ncbi:MAG: hypothetical protein LBT54_07020, partial [Bifidobacteriaceae bacterium]|nr:hypothetical protein [Bifidobacteriaceae bacterium]
MPRASSSPRLLTAVAAAAALALGVSGGALAVAGPPAGGTGGLEDVAVRASGVVAVVTAVAEAAAAPGPELERVSIILDSGDRIDVADPSLAEDLRAGAEVDLDVAIPEAVLEGLAAARRAEVAKEAGAGGVIVGDSAIGELLLGEAAGLGEPLALGNVAAAAVPPFAAPEPEDLVHTFDVVVASRAAGGGEGLTDAVINTQLARLEQFYREETGLDGFDFEANDIRRITSVYSCDNNLIDALWNQAAQAYGHTSALPYYGTLARRHLLVLEENTAACRATSESIVGWGSVGDAGLSGSGVLIVRTATDAISFTRTAGHELGHNFGLDHSNAQICAAAAGAGAGSWAEDQWGACESREYGDRWEFMGSGPSSTVPKMGAIRKHELGIIAPDGPEVATVETASTADFQLNALPTASGLQLILITDPTGGDDYAVEYRSETAGGAAGVFVARVGPTHATTLLRPSGALGTANPPLAEAGDAFVSARGKVVVSLTAAPTGSTAAVQVTRGEDITLSLEPARAMLAAAGDSVSAAVATNEPEWTA